MFKEFGNMVSLIVASVVIIVLGLVYFMVNLWTVKTGAELLGITAVYPVLGAVLLTFAGILSSALSGR